MKGRRINLIVCGKFHYENYVKFLDERGDLDTLYFSHKLSSFRSVSILNRKNLFIKEYLLGLHLALLKDRFLSVAMPVYHAIWSISCRLLFQPSQTNIFLIHGNCLSAIRRSKGQGRIVIGEVVNIHPVELERVMLEESARLGIATGSPVLSKDRILEEIKLCDYLISPSAAVKDSYVRQGFSAEKIHVIPYGCDITGLARKAARVPGRTPKDISIIYAGQISIRKGIHHLLLSVRDQAETLGGELSITLVGRENPVYMSALKSIGIAFRHIPHIPNDRIREEMSKHDIFVLPSIEDGFGMVVMEALEAGVPVLVSKYAGASEIVSQIGGGFVFDPRNHAETIDCIKKISDGLTPPISSKPDGWREYAETLSRLVGGLS